MRIKPVLLAATVFVSLLACDGPASPEVDAGAPPSPLTLNDVSVLYPLPLDGETGLMGPESAGERGPLLPPEVYGVIPGFPVMPADGLIYERLRVVAVRVDGCHDGGHGCEAQVRMVMQPIDPDGSARDSALHLFYHLTDAELGELVAGLRGLRALAPEVTAGPLTVYPALIAQGLGGAYGTALESLLLRFAGASNLRRLTFFLRAPPRVEVWFFGGFERSEAGGITTMPIVGVGETQQMIRNEVTGGGYDYDVNPDAPSPEDGHVLFASADAELATPEQREAAFASFLRVENPAIHTVDALPCAGCHMATFITARARQTYGFTDERFEDDVFRSSHTLSVNGDAPSTPSSLRAFGWFDRAPMIAQRTVNESAMVVDDLEARFP